MLDVPPMMIMTILDKKKLNWPKIPASGRGMVRGKMSHFVAFFVHFNKLIRPHPGPLWGGVCMVFSRKDPLYQSDKDVSNLNIQFLLFVINPIINLIFERPL